MSITFTDDRPVTNLEDIFVWADGTWCYRHELREYGHMSDDVRVLYDDTPEWIDFLRAQDPHGYTR